MNKILAILLPIFWFIFIGTPYWEYSYVIRFITSTLIGACIVYVWKYNDIKYLLLERIENHIFSECDQCNEDELDCICSVKISCD